MLAPAPFVPASQPLPPPTPRERQLTWGVIFLSLAAFWYGVGFAVNALWSSFVA